MIELCEYWEIEAGRTDRHAELFSAIDKLGNSLTAGSSIQPTALTAQCSDDRELLEDCIASLNLEFVISQRAAKVFQHFRSGNTQFIPLTVYDEMRKRMIGNAVLLNVHGRLDFIDLERSSFEQLGTANEKRVKEKIVVCWYTAPPVVYRDVLAEYDFAKAMYGGPMYVCSNELKNAIQENKLANFNFKPLVVR